MHIYMIPPMRMYISVCAMHVNDINLLRPCDLRATPRRSVAGRYPSSHSASNEQVVEKDLHQVALISSHDIYNTYLIYYIIYIILL